MSARPTLRPRELGFSLLAEAERCTFGMGSVPKAGKVLAQLGQMLVKDDDRALDSLAAQVDGRPEPAPPPSPPPPPPPSPEPSPLLTYAQFLERYPAFTLGQLRHLRFHQDRLGFEKAFTRPGKRVLVVVEEFLKAVRQLEERRNAERF